MCWSRVPSFCLYCLHRLTTIYSTSMDQVSTVNLCSSLYWITIAATRPHSYVNHFVQSLHTYMPRSIFGTPRISILAVWECPMKHNPITQIGNILSWLHKVCSSQRHSRNYCIPPYVHTGSTAQPKRLGIAYRHRSYKEPRKWSGMKYCYVSVHDYTSKESQSSQLARWCMEGGIYIQPYRYPTQRRGLVEEAVKLQ